MNRLFFGDNLDIMKRMYHQEHKGEFIDLVYNDPPFNSKRNYNVLFESAELEDTKAQKEAFADTWSNVSYLDTLNEIREIDLNLYNFLNALDHISISKSAISYLTTMAIRIWYMHKLLKSTGSFYLHCDPTMSHYLKIVCDLIFGEKNFRNEISWLRSQPKSHTYINYANCRDIILRYSKTDTYTFNKVYGKHDKKYLEGFYKYKDANGRLYRLGDLTNPNKDRPNLTYEFLGVKRVWRWTRERMEEAYKAGRIFQSKSGQVPQYIRYLDEMPGQPLSDNWNDIEHLHGSNNETLGFPTQKPLALLERIIQASSNPGDLVADFFCGCGTTIMASQKLGRKWVGTDISHMAVKLITKRLVDVYGDNIRKTFNIEGFPKDLASARELASGVKGGRLKFEEWIIEIFLHGVINDKRNQMGFDGHFTFEINGKKNVGLIEVKSGGATPSQLNHFIMTVKERGAQMGIFVCFEDEITDNMRRIAKQQGLYQQGLPYEKIQLMSVEDLLEGKLPQRPLSRVETFGTPDRAPSREEAIKAGKIIADAKQKRLEL